MSANNDSDDLEALFDSIAASSAPVPDQPKVTPPASIASSDADSDDLQALFDSVVAEAEVANVSPETSADVGKQAGGSGEGWSQQEAVFNRIGHMARALHDTLGLLGYDKLIEKTVSALPDAKDRLAYVANLTEQAACRVLNATDIANPLIDDMENGALVLGKRWDKVFANEMGPAEFKLLAADTRAFLNEQLPQKTRETHAQLTEIMMAQDFQDLTGQVIKKIVGLAHELESGLMTVLIEVLPETKRTEEVASLMNGPVINAEGRTDVVVNQEQVDDLLDSLGF
ncbi:protein phosphatase CheZ [Ferribacterium limneticum]|uniref:protein phosphatase CheZ n=1 Tax=Ferribacterium limneticum TaxID=76259 RepID=UPI001CF82C7F|nr:protein phosphatase CheZ [Ferribacterium limneticum]UCV23745.1 protein phosphatase CheZ [Ferribacterium limneticum]